MLNSFNDNELSFSQLKKLCKYLQCKPTELINQDFNVYNEEQAQQAVTEYIKESLCFFNTWFIVDHVKDNLRDEDYYAIAGIIKVLQEKCESSNKVLLNLLEDFDEFVEDAVSADGLGHFLNGYDGEEVELVSDHGDVLFAYQY